MAWLVEMLVGVSLELLGVAGGVVTVVGMGVVGTVKKRARKIISSEQPSKMIQCIM